MKILASVTYNTLGITAYKRKLGPRAEKVFDQWAVMYRAFIQTRFNKYSRGGGDWAPLKVRKGSILRDTSTVFNAMAPQINAPAGSINRKIDFGIEVGYEGSASHPAGATIVEIVYWHHTGAGHLPTRVIIVPPSVQVSTSMTNLMKKALNEPK